MLLQVQVQNELDGGNGRYIKVIVPPEDEKAPGEADAEVSTDVGESASSEARVRKVSEVLVAAFGTDFNNEAAGRRSG